MQHFNLNKQIKMGQYIKLHQLRDMRRKIIARKEKIDNLRDLSNESMNLYMNFILPIMKVYEPILSKLADHNSNSIYRARICKDGKPFLNIKELYNNPKSTSSRAGSIPILYGASSTQTALSEKNVKIGDLVNIATFNYDKIKNGQFWFVGQLDSFYKSQEQSRFLEDERVVQKHFYTESEITTALTFQDALINEIFSKISTSRDGHMLNNYLIEKIKYDLDAGIDFSGVIFVSTKDAPGMNFAIYGDVIKELELQIVNLVKITDIDEYGNISYKLLKNSTPKNNMLNWIL